MITGWVASWRDRRDLRKYIAQLRSDHAAETYVLRTRIYFLEDRMAELERELEGRK